MPKEMFSANDLALCRAEVQVLENALGKIKILKVSDRVKAARIKQAVATSVSAISQIDRSVISNQFLVDRTDNTNVILVDTHPLGEWRLVFTEDNNLVYLNPDGRRNSSKRITSSVWLGVMEGFKDGVCGGIVNRLRYEISLKEKRG